MRATPAARIMQNRRPMRRTSPAQVFAGAVGAILLVAGVAGFFWDASFSTGAAVASDRSALLGILDVNGWHNAVHVLSGAAGLLAAGSWSASRAYAGAVGVGYLAIAMVGLVQGGDSTLLSLLPLNTADDVLHLLIALAGIGAFFAAPAVPAPSTDRRPAN